MLRNCCLLAALCVSWANAQEADVHPPPYRGVSTQVAGVFVTPVPNAPFSAVVKLESTQILPDGSSITRKSTATIARDSRGRIYNERRQLLPSSFEGTSPLLSSHIFDPETRISTLLNPETRVARQQVLPERPAMASPNGDPINNPFFKQEDLGTEMMENVAVHGTRQARTIPPPATGTRQEIVITDEYWYSDELHMNMLTKHSDPRSGVQVLTITRVYRGEPDAAMFQVPAGYKVVDETPPN